MFSVLMIGWIGGLQVLAFCMGLCCLWFGFGYLGFLFCDALFVLLLNVYSVIGVVVFVFWFGLVCVSLFWFIVS